MKRFFLWIWMLSGILLIAGPIAGLNQVQAADESTAGTEQWLPYLPKTNDVVLTPVPEQGLMYVDITFPSSGYRVVSQGNVAIAAGVLPEGGIYYSYLTVGVRLEKWSGISLQWLTSQRLTYNIRYGAKTYFAFMVNYNGTDVKIKDIIVDKRAQ